MTRTAAIDDLRDAMAGPVLLPGDPGHDIRSPENVLHLDADVRPA